MSAVFAFKCWIDGDPASSEIINHRTAGKAKYRYFLSMSECCPDLELKQMRAVKLGAPVTTGRFIDNAVYRGMPNARCGDRVKIGEAHGVIVSHNSSANFDVLFDDDSPKYAGHVLNVHPCEVEFAAQGKQEGQE